MQQLHVQTIVATVCGLLLVSGCAGSDQYQRGRKLIREGYYDQAVVVLRDVVADDPANADYQMALAEAETQAADRHIRQAEELFAQDRATEALMAVRSARDYVPAHPQAIKMVEPLEERIAQAARLAQDARTSLGAEKWAEAYLLALEASRADASHPEVPTLLADTRSAALAHGVNVPEPAPAAQPPAVVMAPSPAPGPVPEASVDRPAPKPPRRSAEQPKRRGEERGGRRARPSATAGHAPAPAEAAPMPTRFRGILSRDDDRYPKKMHTIDGIEIKLEDADEDPLDADLTIRVGRYVLEREDVRVGTPIYGRGASGRSYVIIIEGINPDSETIRFLVEAVAPAPPPGAPQ